MFGKERVGGKVEPVRRALESQRPGTGVKAPRQRRLSNGGIQQAAVGGCVHADGNSKLIVTFFLRAIIAMKPEESTSQAIAFQEIVVLPMGWQQGKVSKLNNGENKSFDPDG